MKPHQSLIEVLACHYLLTASRYKSKRINVKQNQSLVINLVSEASDLVHFDVPPSWCEGHDITIGGAGHHVRTTHAPD